MNGHNSSRYESRKARSEQRAWNRRPLVVPGRITWKDSRGATRFASVVTRDVSDLGVFIECHESAMIPLYRLVHFQVEREARDAEGLPASLRSGKVLSAVYRKGAHRPSNGTPEGFGLRLLIDPRTLAAASVQSEAPALDAAAIA